MTALATTTLQISIHTSLLMLFCKLPFSSTLAHQVADSCVSAFEQEHYIPVVLLHMRDHNRLATTGCFELYSIPVSILIPITEPMDTHWTHCTQAGIFAERNILFLTFTPNLWCCKYFVDCIYAKVTYVYCLVRWHISDERHTTHHMSTPFQEFLK